MSLLIKTTGFEEYLDAAGKARVKVLVLGEHGVGKTPFAASWPRPIFADCEKGMMSVAKRAVPFASIKTYQDFEAFLQHVKLDSHRPPESRKYDTVVIDTINSLQRKLINQRLRAEHKDGMAGTDWNWLGTKMGGYLEDLLNLDLNVVVMMHVKDKYDKDESNDSIIIKDNALKGDLGTSIYRDFDLIGFMESYYQAEGGTRVLKRHIRWQADPKIPMVRDRSNNLPRFTDVDFAESDYQVIFDAVFSDVDSLQQNSQLETIETDEGEVAPADQAGGPVENPSTPKTPAKKAAGKKVSAPKVPAKKAAAAKAPTASKPEPEQPAEPAEQSAPDPDAEAQQLLIQELGATPVVEEKAEEPPVAPPVEKPAQRQGEHVCGDAKPGLTAKVEGCGTPLTATNNAKVQIARLKYHTDLCEACFQRLKTAA